MKPAGVVRIQPSSFSPVQIEDAVRVLQEGGILLYPSDTVYGLACRAGRIDSVERLSAIKGYGSARPFIVLAAELDTARELALIGEDEESFARENWPGPFTMVLPRGPSAPGWVCAPDGTIAVRIPSDPLTRALLAETGCPLASTSANTRRMPAALSFASVEEPVRNSVDLALDGGELKGRTPSRIVRIRPGWIEILR